jgi:DNA-binding response OmpR family regulator
MKLKKQKILIVEDDISLSQILQIALKTKDYEVDIALDGFEAIKKISQNLYDLILLDINLPKMSGFEVAKKLKMDEKTKNIPIIMITALGQEENIKRGFELGCEDYIIKPFNLEYLCLKIQKYLK